MENLFKFARKELSQDAFLLWLLANASCDDEEVKIISLNFIEFLTKKQLDIKEVKVEAQWRNIDIKAEITTNTNETYIIFIEDKTTSNEHNQLDTYNKSIGNLKNIINISKIFYKADWIKQEEKARIDEANWEKFDIDSLKGFWEKYTNSSNQIINMYANRICAIYSALNTNVIPNKDNYIGDRNLEMFAWKGFFKNTLPQDLKDKFDVSIYKTNYNYISLNFNPKGTDIKNRIYPYIEVRDRDCLNGELKVLLLTYDMSGKKERWIGWNEYYKAYENIIKQNPNKNIFKKGNKTKRILASSVKYKDKKEFWDKLKERIIIYTAINEEYDRMK